MKKQKDFYQVSLKLFLKNPKGEILALKAVDDGTFAGYYDLPGGRIDTDEFKAPFAEIIMREVAEEIGEVTIRLNPKPVALGRHLILPKFNNQRKAIHVLYVFFEGLYVDGAMRISKEHTDYAWLDLDKINPRQYFTSGILEGVQMYLNMTPSSSPPHEGEK